MTAATNRDNSVKVKKASSTTKVAGPKTASSGIMHQVIMPKALPTAPPMSQPSKPISLPANRTVATVTTTHRSNYAKKTNGRVSKRNGVWYLGGNHVVKLLTSVDGDLDHSILSKLAAVPTVVGELALSVESLVSDDITVGGFENDLLAKIASNTLTAKREIMAAKAAAAPKATPICTTPTPLGSASMGAAAAASTHKKNKRAPSSGSEQVPNPLLANYQPVPNPLAIRITPPASPHTSAATEQSSAGSPKTTKTLQTKGLPLIHAR